MGKVMLRGDSTRHSLVAGYLSYASDVMPSDLRAYGITREGIESVGRWLRLRKDMQPTAYALWQRYDGNKAAVAAILTQYM